MKRHNHVYFASYIDVDNLRPGNYEVHMDRNVNKWEDIEAMEYEIFQLLKRHVKIMNYKMLRIDIISP